MPVSRRSLLLGFGASACTMLGRQAKADIGTEVEVVDPSDNGIGEIRFIMTSGDQFNISEMLVGPYRLSFSDTDTPPPVLTTREAFNSQPPVTVQPIGNPASGYEAFLSYRIHVLDDNNKYKPATSWPQLPDGGSSKDFFKLAIRSDGRLSSYFMRPAGTISPLRPQFGGLPPFMTLNGHWELVSSGEQLILYVMTHINELCDLSDPKWTLQTRLSPSLEGREMAKDKHLPTPPGRLIPMADRPRGITGWVKEPDYGRFVFYRRVLPGELDVVQFTVGTPCGIEEFSNRFNPKRADSKRTDPGGTAFLICGLSGRRTDCRKPLSPSSSPR